MSSTQAAVPALGRLWFDELIERCAKEGVVLPGPENLHQKFNQPEVPPAARGKLAQVMHVEWVKGRADVPPWQLQALVEAIEAWWHLLPDGSSPLTAGLAPAWVRAQGTLGHIEPLADAALRWQDPLAAPEHEAVALGLLRQLRRIKGEASIAPSLALIDALGQRWQPEATWTQEVVGTLAMVARAAETLPPLQRVAAWLDRLAPHAGRPDARGWQAPLTAAAVRCAALPVLRQLAEVMLDDDEPDPAGGFSLAAALEALGELAPSPSVHALVARAAKAWPKQPTIQVEHAKLKRAEGATVQQLAAPLLTLEAAHPATPAAWQLLAEYAFHDGDIALAKETYQRLAELGQLDEHSQLRLDHLSLHQSGAAVAASAGGTLPEAGTAELDPAQLGPLAEPLAALGLVLANAPRHDSPVSLADTEARCQQTLAAFERMLPALDGLTLAEIRRAVGHLWALANSGALDLAHWEGVFPFEIGPAFGTLDGHRCRAQCLCVLQHMVALCRHAVRRERPLLGAPGAAGLAMLLDLLRQQLDAQLAMKQADQAVTDLEDAAARLGGLGQTALAALREQALLAAGRVDTLRAEFETAHAGTGAPHGPETWPLREWDDWLHAEGVTAHALLHDEPLVGQFDVVDVTGRVRSHAHEMVGTTLSLARVTDLRVRNVHLLIGTEGGVLKPHAWHLQMGEFPYPHPNVLARGAGGTVLRGAGLWKRLDEPLVVLANMDAPFHRNYYHWMVLTLARIQALLARGILKTRKLLLPRELTGWMLSSLHDIGLDETRVRWYSADDDLRLTDAVIASPSEFASATMVEGLRRALTQAAGLDPDVEAPGDRLIYLARRGETRRPMVEAEQVINIAEELGFEIVAAETLSLLDQVRLFASARGIAGPPGAAFTNLMWAPPGTRVLTIFKQDINGPTFFDLSFLRGQQHRWLQARSIAGFESVSIVTSPFSVDVDLARRELQWVRDGE